MNYKITYSNRKTVAIYVHTSGEVEVKCPIKTNKNDIEKLVEERKKWIEKSIQKMSLVKYNIITEDQKKEYIEKSKLIIPKKVEFYGKIMGVKPASIKISNAKSYWGCCTGKNGVNFSWRLMMLSDKAIDYVVVHELAHIKEHNHSKLFWNEVRRVIPDYKVYAEELKKYR